MAGGFFWTREQLERGQVLVYAGAVALGAGLGLGAPGLAQGLGAAVWPLLALLLFSTFLQVPLDDLGAALRRKRDLGALLLGNFAAVPLLVWGLAAGLPDEPWLRMGFFLVLLAPCTDWYCTFTHLGRGDGRLALASTPVLLLLQLLLLPLYLYLFLGPELASGMSSGPFLRAFGAVVLLPLLSAYGFERAARRRPALRSLLQRSVWLPVPLLALVLLVMMAGEARGMLAAAAGLAPAVARFMAYLGAVPVLTWVLVRAFGLGRAQGRTLLFSLGTRNSFVVLPLVLAWPGAGPLAAAAVVAQALVELTGMLAYLAVLGRKR